MLTQDQLKLAAAQEAIAMVPEGEIIGVGSGSTVNMFIDELAKIKDRIKGAVASSEASAARLRAHGIQVFELNEVHELPVYVDGADEINHYLQMTKGGGGALTREKIVAAASRDFICIADESKYVEVLGAFPLPVEVLPMARSYVARELVKLGGSPDLRIGFTTDNGNQILDVRNMEIAEPVKMENRINQISGEVCNGLFAVRRADVLLLSTQLGVITKR